MKHRILNVAAWSGVALSASYGLLILFFMSVGKPYTDEIYLAVMVREHGGVFEGYIYWMNYMSSMPVKELLTFLLIGAPSAYIDWKYANAVGMIIPIVAFITSLTYLFKSILNIKLGFKLFTLLGLMSVFAIMIAPTVGVDLLEYYDLSENNIIHSYWKYANISWMWSAALVNYLLSMSLIVLLAAVFVNKPEMKNKYLYLILFGLFVGFGNANTSVIVAAVLTLSLLFKNKVEALTGVTWKNLVFTVSTITVSFGITNFLPGNVARREYSGYLIESYHETFISGMLQDMLMMLSPGFFVIPIAVGLMSFFAIRKINHTAIKSMRWELPAFFLAAGVIALTVNNLIAIVLYKSYWHELNPQILLIISGILFGYKFAERLSLNASLNKFNMFAHLAAFLIIVMSFSNVYKLGNYTLERSDKWWTQYSTHINCGDLAYFWSPDVYKALAEYRDVPKFNIEASDKSSCDATNMFTS